MKKIALYVAVASMVVINLANAEAPTVAAFEAYQAFIARYDDDLLAKKNNETCFAEHICAAEGTIGLVYTCDHQLSRCLHRRVTFGESIDSSSSYIETCAPLFKAMTPAQNAIMMSPIGCEIPPPASAFQASLTSGEAKCLANMVCTEGASLLGDEKMCLQEYATCTRPLSAMEPLERSTCRGLRVVALTGKAPRLSPNGPCPPGMADPVLATVTGQINSSQSVRSNPLSQQGQGSKTTGSNIDEFDLGDLDF